MISIKNYLLKKKDLKKEPSTRFFRNQNRTIILSFKKAVLLYILSIKTYDIRKWRQVEFKKEL